MFKLVILINVVKLQHGIKKNDKLNQIIKTNINCQLCYTLITVQNDFRISVFTILCYSYQICCLLNNSIVSLHAIKELHNSLHDFSVRDFLSIDRILHVPPQ